MKINNKEIDINSAYLLADQEKHILHRRENNLLLSDFQINVLERYNIDYKKYINLKNLLFDIESILNECDDDELDNVSKQISEIIYYNQTNK